jgi:hypothetical protein
MRSALGRILLLQVALVMMASGLHSPKTLRAEEDEQEPQGAPSTVAPAGTVAEATPLQAEATAVVRFDKLAAQEALGPSAPNGGPSIRTWMPNEQIAPAEPYFPPAPAPSGFAPKVPLFPMAASPPPSSSFMGLNDVAMADSNYIVIPPDVGGAVGPTKIMEAFNNNYRIRDKATGVTISTVGTATFWASVVAVGERLSLTDPRTLYDPYNNRWIAVMQTVTSGAGKILVGVSQTNDPSGAWNLYSFLPTTGGPHPKGFTLDFPNLGFNKNWISITINAYTMVFQEGITLAVDYPSARAGTGTGTLFLQSSGTHFCSAPALTYSSTTDTLYVVTHLSSSGATYTLDTITGTAAAPVYTTGAAALTRTGGGWVQPGGNTLPQSGPVAGASACGATPCPIECQDSQVRSAPVFRKGFLYYTQTIGLPTTGQTHTAVQWTKIATPSGAFVDGGRIDDPTATSSNGGKWYAYPHIAVNLAGDFIVGYSQFSSAQHPSAGYSIHLVADAAGTLRDPQIYHAGEDYYHKTFSTATGRNRWGDFSTAQVDPSDDTKLWTLQEYAKARTGTDDGNTGSNSSRWSSWWAGVIPANPFTITASAGANGSISPGTVAVTAGSNVTYNMFPNPCYHVANVQVDGGSVGAVTTYTFTNVQADHTISVSFAINGPYTITATAGTGGSISPSGAVGVACGATQAFSMSPAGGFSILDVKADGSSVGAVASYQFTNVQANHTIDAQFKDTGSPVCHVNFPNGGDSLAVGAKVRLAWTNSDNVGVTCVDLLLSRTGAGGPYDTLAACIPDTSHYDWIVYGPLTTHAIFKVIAHDGSGNTGQDQSDAEFSILTTTTAVSEQPGNAEFSLMALSRNPVQGAARLMLAVPASGHVQVAVYDVAGREVAVLADRDFAPGRYEITWDARNRGAPAGLYFIRATGLGKNQVRRMIVTH